MLATSSNWPTIKSFYVKSVYSDGRIQYEMIYKEQQKTSWAVDKFVVTRSHFLKPHDAWEANRFRLTCGRGGNQGGPVQG